jgi:hypothetical protein
MAKTAGRICNAIIVQDLLDNGYNELNVSQAFVWSQTDQGHAWWFQQFEDAAKNDGVLSAECHEALNLLLEKQKEFELETVRKQEEYNALKLEQEAASLATTNTQTENNSETGVPEETDYFAVKPAITETKKSFKKKRT